MDRHPHQDAERVDVLLSASLYLISRYAAAAMQGTTCSRLAVAIQCHLEILAERVDVSRLVRDTCGLLAEEWRRSVANEAERPCGPALLALVAKARMK